MYLSWIIYRREPRMLMYRIIVSRYDRPFIEAHACLPRQALLSVCSIHGTNSQG